MLSWLGLEFPARRKIGNQRDVDKENVFAPHDLANLTRRLKEWLRLDIAYRSANLCDDDIRNLPVLIGKRLCAHTINDFVGDMGNHLNAFAQILTGAFLRDHTGIHLPCC